MSTTQLAVQRQYATVGATRPVEMFRLSTMWSIGAVANSPKTCAHPATKDFGANATLHPRPEEAPL